MRYRTLGKTGYRVSSLGFGLMRLPDNQGGMRRDLPADPVRTRELVAKAFELGINYFDTAYPYHQKTSETVLGMALEDLGIRKDCVIATKLPSASMKSPESWESIFSEQLQKLRTDHVDVYLVHNLNRVRWADFLHNGGLDFLTRLKREGRARAVGFSLHDETEIFRAVLDGYDWDVCQIQFNYLDIQLQAGLAGYAYAAAKGVPVISMETLKGGMLACPPPAEIQAVWDDPSLPRRSPAEWAIRWVLDHAGLAVALSGMGHEDELLANAACADHAPDSLSEQELAAIARVRQIYQSMYRIQCTGCAYCIPCPQGVTIPYLFRLYNNYKLFNETHWAKIQYGQALANGMAFPSCVGCGHCVRQCPQGLAIPELLRDIHEELRQLLPA